MNTPLIANRYRLETPLTHINHSDFYDAYDTQAQGRVIVRLINLDEPRVERKLQGFMDNEARVLKQLNHPNILRILDYGVEGTLYYLVHEHTPFKTLQAYRQERGRLDIESALRCAVELSDVLSRLHHIGIIHCDVKPDNVLFDGTSVKLIEFSIANHVLDSDMVTGTPPYMSPEAAMGAAPAVTRDVWALGVTLFELLTGKLPYMLPGGRDQPEDMPELLAKIVQDPVPDISQYAPGLPPRLVALLHWMLEKEPSKRLSSMRQVGAELETVLAEIAQGRMAITTGDVIGGRYRLQTVIGEGAFGQVFRAADLETGQTVAIKQLKPEFAGNAEQLARFLREIDLLYQLDHPGIVKVLNTVKVGASHYVALEYIADGDLRSRLKRGRLPMRDAIKIALELADALARTHHLNVIHRDIKPENVLLAADGTPRLTDFGIAHVDSADHLTQTGFVLGTIRYAAPEVVNGDPASKQSDIWSLGILLYEMLTGSLPFEHATLSKLLIAILEAPVPSLRDACDDCVEPLVILVKEMLQRDPANRVGSMREVASRLEQILQGA
jgi:serine/threonine protein kinase